MLHGRAWSQPRSRARCLLRGLLRGCGRARVVVDCSAADALRPAAEPVARGRGRGALLGLGGEHPPEARCQARCGRPGRAQGLPGEDHARTTRIGVVGMTACSYGCFFAFVNSSFSSRGFRGAFLVPSV